MRVLLLLILLHQRPGIFVHAWCSFMAVTTRNKMNAQQLIRNKETTTATTLSLVRHSLSHHHSSNTEKRRGTAIISTPPPTTALCMGLFDSLFSSFLQNRQGDFVQLDKSSTEAFGPGPLLLLYNVPAGIQVQEVLDIIHDGAPSAHAQGCTVVRLDDVADDIDASTEGGVWNLSLQQALQNLLTRGENIQSTGSSLLDTLTSPKSAASFKPSLSTTSLQESSISVSTKRDTKTSTPVLFFSGFSNVEMMNVYDILGQEIFQEMLATSSASSPPPPPAACAKAVPKAMNKPLRQVLEEISGDHQDAIAMTKNDDNNEQ